MDEIAEVLRKGKVWSKTKRQWMTVADLTERGISFKGDEGNVTRAGTHLWDGQHRINAVIQSGVTVQFRVRDT